MDTLDIGKVITSVLLGNDAISRQLGDRVYPLVADEGTMFPFLIYRRSSLQPASTKDGMHSCTAYVDIAIATERYGEGILIAKAVKDVLTSSHGILSGISIDEISLTDAGEEYAANAFVQNLTFKIEIDE